MRRITLSVDDELADAFDRLFEKKGYANRSEAFRDLLRDVLDQERIETGRAKHCVGALSYIYNHHERQLAGRLTQMQHDHHDVTVATMHAHLDHEDCIEAVLLKGPTNSVLEFARSVMAETGVRHGRFHPISVDAETVATQRGHVHLHPHT